MAQSNSKRALPTAKRFWRKLLEGVSLDREFLLYISSFVVFQGSRFFVFLWAARELGLIAFGIWNLLNLILVYSGLVHLGVLSGMNRDVPFYRGRGETKKVEEIKSAALSSMLVTGLLGALAILFFSLAVDEPFRVPLMLMAPLLFVSQCFSYLQTYLRSNLRFGLMSVQQLAYALLFPLVVIPLTLVFDLGGFILGQGAAILLICAFFALVIPIRLRFSLNTALIRSLIRTGFPILMVGLLYGLLTTTDRWIIAGLLGIRELGFYSLAILVSGMLTLIPTAISMQVYPRMAQAFGAHGKYRALTSWMLRQSVLSLLVVVPLAVAVYFVMPFVVQSFLPQYVEGIPAMKIILIGVVVLPLCRGFAAFLNTVGKQVFYMGVQGAAVALNLGLNYLFVTWGWGIEGVALGTSITHILYTLSLMAVSLWLMRNEGR